MLIQRKQTKQVVMVVQQQNSAKGIGFFGAPGQCSKAVLSGICGIDRNQVSAIKAVGAGKTA